MYVKDIYGVIMMCVLDIGSEDLWIVFGILVRYLLSCFFSVVGLLGYYFWFGLFWGDVLEGGWVDIIVVCEEVGSVMYLRW